MTEANLAIARKIVLYTGLLVAGLLLSASAQAQTITGKVVGVSDGDTITVLDASNRQHKICLEGIDAPESKQDYGSRAKLSLSDLVFGKTVTVTSSKNYKYGRTLGRVTLDRKDINRGMAWFYRAYQAELPANVAAVYGLAETLARQEKRGLWADASPVPPWDFRRGKTAEAPGEKLTYLAPIIGPGVIGNRIGKIYHLPNCPDYSKVSARNQILFETEAEAHAAGYRKARNCPQ